MGDLIIEIPGDISGDKTNYLEKKLKDVFVDTGVKIYRPNKKAEMKVFNLDESIVEEDIVDVISEEGICLPRDITCSSIRRSRSGLGAAWIKCPVAAAIKLAANGKIKIEWSEARVELVDRRPIHVLNV
jgi:hypothetical protein